MWPAIAAALNLVSLFFQRKFAKEDEAKEEEKKRKQEREELYEELKAAVVSGNRSRLTAILDRVRIAKEARRNLPPG